MVGSNTDLSSTPTFTVDTIAPAVTVTAPAASSRTADNTPSLGGAAGNATGDSTTVTVKIFAGTGTGGSPIQTQNLTRSAASWSGTATALADGTYTIQAVQTDTANNTASTPGTTFTVDTAAPAVTVTAPIAGSRTADNTPSLGGAAGNATGDLATVTVKIFAGTGTGGSPVQTLPVTRSGASWSGTAGSLPDGTYTVQAVQADDVGNSTSTAGTTFVVDTTAPTVTVTSPAASSRTADDTPTLTGAAGNATGDSGNVTVEIFAGTTTTGAALQTHTVARGGAAWSDTAATLADGTYTVRATQTDDLGNSASTSGTTFVVDTAAPGLTIVTPADGGATNDTTPSANGAAGNAVGDSATVTLRVFAGATATGSPLQTATVTRSGAAWASGIAALAPGTYTLEATQGDDLSHSTVVTSTFNVDTTAPVVTLTSPADGSSSVDATPTFAGTASEPGAGVTVRVYNGGNLVQTLAAPNGASGWTVDAAPALAPGTYTAQAAQSDAAGNTGVSPTRVFTVTTPPTSSGAGPITPVTPAAAPAAPAPGPGPAPAADPILLSPFPIVRIVGVLTPKGVRLSLLSIRAPAGSFVDVRCQGKSCPIKRGFSRVGDKTRTVTVKRMTKVTLLAGVVIEVRVRHVARVGKFTRFRIRRGKSPLRLDTCVMPGSPDPARCPS